jgi:hypothetical protein
LLKEADVFASAIDGGVVLSHGAELASLMIGHGIATASRP